jgi:hypothetical protein
MKTEDWLDIIAADKSRDCDQTTLATSHLLMSSYFRKKCYDDSLWCCLPVEVGLSELWIRSRRSKDSLDPPLI